ncbi:MAG: membrane protein insertase YidC [Bdellovibrionales bacterium]|nr:membrane protein insertase YidC [Bdellovibrionales bacterium]
MNEQQSFLDPKTLLAILLLGGVWIGWQFHLQNKYPDAYKPQQEKTVSQESESSKSSSLEDPTAVSGAVAPNKEVNKVSQTPEEVPEHSFQFEDGTWSFSLSSKGMGIQNIQLKTYKDRDGQAKKVGKATDEFLFGTRLIGHRKLLDFKVERESETKFVGKARKGSLEITKTIVVDSSNYTFDTQIFVNGAEENFLGVETLLADLVNKDAGGSFFMPSIGHQEFFVSHDDEEDRVYIQADNAVSENYDKVRLFGLSSQYFSLAVLDKSNVMPEVKAKVDQQNKMTGSVTHTVLSKTGDFSVKYVGFAGPKSLNLLTTIDEQMASLVDFGMFSVIGRVILKIMKGFHEVVGNWGVAIILLTILVRLIVLPFNIMSYKSMKGMQKIQPDLKRIREKYKDDKMKLNQETMALMKEANANPLGGCLPMLLQFPIFIALYQVIGQSIELYQEPFALWIHDLSLKDPYYVLPVLMSITIFLQQKMTPTQMDPAQQKVMLFMPLIFMVFMVSLPSGLTLYMFVSALFAVGQQAFFMRNKEEPANA